MKSFSQRKGLKKVRTIVQTDSMDSDLRNCLWNALTAYYWSKATKFVDPLLRTYALTEDMDRFLRILWHKYFKETFDSIPSSWSKSYDAIRKHYFACNWNEVYDFLEFVANNYPVESINKKFMEACNEILESELSAYRFVGGLITQITSEEEISEIEEALATPLKPLEAHLENSLKLLSDRKSPDYRNSIKESISAVETICRLITKDEKATLGQALKEVETKVGLHGALEKAFSNLYGYTSSAEGIRHSLMDEPTLSFEDAKFMLVSCSAFINYLVSKSEKAQIKL